MKNLTLAAVLCGTIVGIPLGASAQQKAATPSKSTTHAKSGLPHTALPHTNLPHTNLPHTDLPHTNLPGAKSKSTPTKTPAKTSSTLRKTPTTAANRRTSTYNTRYASYNRPVRHYAPQQPTPDRYREIQDALAAKGYLKTPSSGVWDADSIDAMQRFQKDQNLDPTGKLTARSLTALGLGTKQPEGTSSLGLTAGVGSSEETPLQ